MTLKQALKRIEELERKVAQLEALPAQHIHYHTHPAPMYQPLLPQPYTPCDPTWPNRYEVTCGGMAQPVIGVTHNAQ